MKILLTGFVSLCLLSHAHAQFAADLFSGKIKIRDAMIPFYSGTERDPTMVVRVDRICTEYQRKGFFRIGVLPVGVLDGVTVEVRHLEQATNSLAQLQHWLSGPAANRLELRHVRVLILAGSTNRLESGHARVASGGKWELLDGVRFNSGTNQVQSSHASLQVAGEHTGQLILATTPSMTTNLFATSKIIKPTTTKDRQ